MTERQRTPIGERIRVTRLRLGLSQYDLATAAGIRSQTVYRYEAGLALPNTTSVDRLAKALDVSPTWLLRGEEVPTTTTVAGEAHPALTELLATPLGRSIPDKIVKSLAEIQWGRVEPSAEIFLQIAKKLLDEEEGSGEEGGGSHGFKIHS